MPDIVGQVLQDVPVKVALAWYVAPVHSGQVLPLRNRPALHCALFATVDQLPQLRWFGHCTVALDTQNLSCCTVPPVMPTL